MDIINCNTERINKKLIVESIQKVKSLCDMKYKHINYCGLFNFFNSFLNFLFIICLFIKLIKHIK